MKKIGILGGTFNPPHYGHLLIANEVLSSLQLDEIWFMPNQEPPHKEKPAGVSNKDRLMMLKLATAGHPSFRIETIELERAGPSFTFETMKILTDRYRDDHFYFIIGADMIEYLPKWHKLDELLKMVQFVGVKRPSFQQESPYPILYVDTPQMDISSKMIRDRLIKGKTIRYLLPEPVRLYIEEKRLYES